MTARRRKTIIYALFVAAVIWGVYNFSPGDKALQSDDSQGSLPSDSIPTASVQNAGINYDTDRFAEWGRDPFARHSRTAYAAVSPAPALKLTAVSKSGSEFLAIINGRVLGIGEEIEGWKVSAISDKEAWLIKNTDKILLKIRN